MLGSLVRRLDIISVQENELPMPGEVFGYLSNIRILIVTSLCSHNMPQSVFEAIGPHCSPTLQKLVCDMKRPPWGGYLTRLSNVRTLLRVQRGFCLHDLPNLQFTDVDSWHDECSPDSGRYAAMSCPDLRHVLRWQEDSVDRQAECRACVAGFLSKRAPELVTMHLETRVNISKPVFKLLAENCPRLTHIVFYYLSDESWSEEPFDPDEFQFMSNGGWVSEYNNDGESEGEDEDLADELGNHGELLAGRTDVPPHIVPMYGHG